MFSRHLLLLCKLHPSLVVDQSHELLEFAGTTANVYSKEEIYTHVVMILVSMCVCMRQGGPADLGIILMRFVVLFKPQAPSQQIGIW